MRIRSAEDMLYRSKHNPTMTDDSHHETPDASIVAFNSNYQAAAQMKAHPEQSFSRSFDEVIESMSEELWRICTFLTGGGSPTRNIIAQELESVFESDEIMQLDNWGPIEVTVFPPSKTSNLLDRRIGQKAMFQMGHLVFEIEGNPTIKTNGGQQSVVTRMANLFAMIDVSQSNQQSV